MAPKILQNLSPNRLLRGFLGGLVKSCFLTPKFPPFFRLREASWSELGPKLAPSWPKLGASWAKLGPRCAMLAPSWPKLAPKSPKFAPKRTQDGLPKDFFTVFKGCPNFYRFLNRFCIDFPSFFDPSEP